MPIDPINFGHIAKSRGLLHRPGLLSERSYPRDQLRDQLILGEDRQASWFASLAPRYSLGDASRGKIPRTNGSFRFRRLLQQQSNSPHERVFGRTQWKAWLARLATVAQRSVV